MGVGVGVDRGVGGGGWVYDGGMDGLMMGAGWGVGAGMVSNADQATPWVHVSQPCGHENMPCTRVTACTVHKSDTLHALCTQDYTICTAQRALQQTMYFEPESAHN